MTLLYITKYSLIKIINCYNQKSIYSIKGILLPAPYVDEYGECDEGLKRGNPLKLNKAMYEDLKKVCQLPTG